VDVIEAQSFRNMTKKKFQSPQNKASQDNHIYFTFHDGVGRITIGRVANDSLDSCSWLDIFAESPR